jgi:UDP-N-acetylglucosamine 4,6-dehydratase/5-epimerase
MNLNDKVILVTGGTGSFGRMFAATVLKHHAPRKLIIFSRDELKQSEMHRDFASANIRYFIGDVRDLDRVRRAMRGVDIVVHAAAMKQVPACEYNPFEAVKTNVVGGANVIEASIDAGVKKVLAISTDKAVNPVNLYGATKLCAEKLFVQGNSYAAENGTRFSCARYGNVVGSRGSVIPLFLEQRRTGVLTVTDERMTRFWITLQQGVDFVIQCLTAMEGGEIFVPKIPSMRILDLAKAMAPDSEIRFTGIRPGEKVHEVLVSEDEAHHALEFDDFFIIKPAHPWWRVANWPDGRPVADGYRFSSDTNERWLSLDELRAMVV